MAVFYLFAAFLLLQALVSLRGGVRYLRYFRRQLSAPEPDFAPHATVIVPCRGLDQDLRENLSALCRQTYPAFEIVFVVDSPDDPALQIIERVRSSLESSSPASARVVVA